MERGVRYTTLVLASIQGTRDAIRSHPHRARCDDRRAQGPPLMSNTSGKSRRGASAAVDAMDRSAAWERIQLPAGRIGAIE